MPKLVPEGEKRVALNCLVSPKTLVALKAMDCSQGEGVDRAVAALSSQAKYTPEIEAKIQRNVRPREPRPFRGELLKPKDRK